MERYLTREHVGTGSDDPHGVRFGRECHWCISDAIMRRGTGLRFDLAPRLRQVLTMPRSNGDMPRPRETENIVTRMGVQANWPLKMWWVIAERHHPELIALLPPYEELACQRCHGTGKLKGTVRLGS